MKDGWDTVWIQLNVTRKNNVKMYNFNNKTKWNMVDAERKNKKIKFSQIGIIYTILVWFECKSSIIENDHDRCVKINDKKTSSMFEIEKINKM